MNMFASLIFFGAIARKDVSVFSFSFSRDGKKHSKVIRLQSRPKEMQLSKSMGLGVLLYRSVDEEYGIHDVHDGNHATWQAGSLSKSLYT